MTQNHEALRLLDKAEAKAHRAMMNGSYQDASTVHENWGKNYKAWVEAADACRGYREAHGLIGQRGYRGR